MSVTTRVTVAYPDNSPTLPVVGSPVQYNPFVHAGSLRPWSVYGLLSGDSSGGTVIIDWEMRPIGDGALFVTVTQFSLRTDDTNAQYTRADGSGDPWEYSIYRKKALDVTTTWIPNDLITVDQPRSLGSVKAGTTGNIQAVFQTNTNVKTYVVNARGWFSDRPFLTPLNATP